MDLNRLQTLSESKLGRADTAALQELHEQYNTLHETIRHAVNSRRYGPQPTEELKAALKALGPVATHLLNASELRRNPRLGGD